MVFGGDGLPRFYEAIPSADLARDVMQRRAGQLRVLAVPPCGWTDLGTPERVATCLETFFSASCRRDTPALATTRIDLRDALRRCTGLPPAGIAFRAATT
jgi:hypothetical protein